MDEQKAPVNASAQELQAHRNALGQMLQKLDARGVNIEQLAQNAGVPTTDVDALTKDDLITLTRYMAQNHPEFLQEVAARFPAAQKLIGMVAPLSGMFGQFFERGEQTGP